MTDVAPELLEAVRMDFTAALENDKLIAQVYRQIADSTATHKHSNAFAQRVGELLADALQANISADKLPDGRMYYNIAQRVLEPLLTDNYELAADVAAQVQELLNNAAGFGMKAIRPKLDTERVGNIINKVSSAENYDDVAWMLDEPVVNFTQTAVDDTIRENVEFQARSGLSPKVTRRVVGGCCEWCSNLAGVYDYPVPREIYRRHNYCRCLVLYDPGDGRKQDAHSKKWYDNERDARIARSTELERQQQEAGGLLNRIAAKPAMLGGYTPEGLYNAIKQAGYDVKPLNNGSHKGVPFENGGGFKVNFADGGLLMYHPAERSHHDGAYYKISTGKGGIKRYDELGNEKKK